MRAFALLLCLLLLGLPSRADAEDGYRLWLRYPPVEGPPREQYRHHATAVLDGDAPNSTIAVASKELQRGLGEMLQQPLPPTDAIRDGTILIGTPRSSPLIARLHLPLARLGDEGYLIRTVRAGGRAITVIAGNRDVGVLYGAFAFLRLVQTGQAIDRLDISDRPKLQIRMLDHWDNLDRTVERGYAGFSIWVWRTLPDARDRRYTDYARANASIGINGAALNNVNADTRMLTRAYLRKAAALADVFRPYGIRIYLSVRFSSPVELGGLKTADPLDPTVRRWWRLKADEVYRLIPNFGGFLVKANSEGQPGPQDYGRSHADGANMIAAALAPHGGTVIWRAFVYSAKRGEDRAKQAYEEFHPLDGKFPPNVILQVKNGPVDFQPREPFHPLFGQMPHTPVMLEAQVTKEYLGFATHLAYLGTMWEEVLGADTCSPRCRTPVEHTLTGMAGVANVGSARDWTGSHFNQANWYAFGRLAWNPALPARAIAEEWARMTWSNDAATVGTIVPTMMQSRQAVVNYMTPLGLHHLMATGHHYGPGPWVGDLERPDWNPTYYHRADSGGIGFDRTGSGSNAVAQYSPPVGRCFASLSCVSDDYLLWFHHLPWDYRMRSGRALWDELATRYTLGVDQVHAMRRAWQSLRGRVDDERFDEVDAFLAIQEREAQWWRDASIAYFQSVSKRPLPPGVARPAHELSYYQSLQFVHAPGDYGAR